MKRKPAGITPMTSAGVSFNWMTRPAMLRIAAEASLPELMAEHHDARRVRPIVIHRDRAAEQRTHAEQREELADTTCMFSRAGAPAPVRVAVPERQAASWPSVRLSRCQSSQLAGDTTLRVRPTSMIGEPEIRQALVDRHQLVAVRIGQRTQQQLIDDREDCGVGADAEGEREDDGEREARALAQAAGHVFHVADEIFDRHVTLPVR